jgi:acetyl-CoA carboxylase carboxyl transferase subunit beta
MAWFKKPPEGPKKVKIPEGMWVKCEACREIIYRKEIERNLKVCPKCNYHFRLSAQERLALLVEPQSFQETDQELQPADPLGFKDSMSYRERLRQNAQRSGLKEAVLSGLARMGSLPSASR